jgi:L,D-transpeptidase YcbB
VFAANMKQVVFRPYWNVPPSIQRAELVPKLNRDPTYLAKNNFEVVTPQDAVVTNGAVDAATLAQLHSGKLRIRQTPGPKNSLGLVKFLFPNEHDVYLHDTPATELFARSRRDFSHGCVRVEKPRDLAAWVLRDQPKWTPESIADAMNGTETVSVTLPQPIPVLIVYGTAVVVKNGDVHFFDDIYGLDAELDQELAKAYTNASAPTSAGRGPRLRE